MLASGIEAPRSITGVVPALLEHFGVARETAERGVR
jgi:hypothetical protein